MSLHSKQPLRPPARCRCIYDAKPRHLAAEEATMLANLAELATRRLEQDQLHTQQGQVR